MSESHKGTPVVTFSRLEDWEQWLKSHGEEETAVWVKMSKKGAPKPTISYVEAREGAIIYGWIDGLVNALDDHYYLTRFTPRKPRSVWSKINREVVEDLIARGRMKPEGLVHVEAAKADGRWDAAYEGQASMEVPDDFAAALKKNKKAADFFDTLTRSQRYSFLWNIHTAKRAETRAARIEKFIGMLERGEKMH